MSDAQWLFDVYAVQRMDNDWYRDDNMALRQQIRELRQRLAVYEPTVTPPPTDVVQRPSDGPTHTITGEVRPSSTLDALPD